MHHLFQSASVRICFIKIGWDFLLYMQGGGQLQPFFRFCYSPICLEDSSAITSCRGVGGWGEVGGLFGGCYRREVIGNKLTVPMAMLRIPPHYMRLALV